MATQTAPEARAESKRLPPIYPRLAYRDEYAALEYLVRVFGFTEDREFRLESPAGMLAWLRLGDGVVMIGRAEREIHRIYSPLDVGQATAMINVEVQDLEAHYRRAVAEGAEITIELEDFLNSRRYEASDLEGQRWHFSEAVADIAT